MGRGIRRQLTLLSCILGAAEASGAQLTASWDDNSNGIATTRVERRLGTDTVFTGIADVPPGVTSYVDTSVSTGTTYCYRAVAWDAAGVSPYSNEACATSASASQLSVSVSKAGNGAGTVASSPAGIDCGTTCSAAYAGTSVTLTATAASGSTFTGWTGGACTGTAPCIVVGNAPVALTATFTRAPSTSLLAASPATGPAGTEFTFTLNNWSGSAFDWLTIVPVGAADTTYGIWLYARLVPGTGSTKTWRIVLKTPGTYEARLLLNNGFTRAATSAPITVAGTVASPNPVPSLGVASGLSVSPATGPMGTEFLVTLADWSGGDFDWLTVVPTGAASTTYGAWSYVRSVPGTGNVKAWRVTLNTAGTFEARLLQNNGYTRVATSGAFTVAGSGSSPTPGLGVASGLSVSPATGAAGTEFSVTLTDWSGGAFDWLAIVPVGAANTTYGPWTYVRAVAGTGSTKTWRVTLSTPGTFEARLLLNNAYSRAATSPAFTVGGATVAVAP